MITTLDDTVYISKGRYHDHTTIELRFDYHPEIVSAVKKLPRRSYDPITKCWHLPYSQESIRAIHLAPLKVKWSFDPTSTTETSPQYGHHQITRPWSERIELYRQYLAQQRYSTASITQYVQVIQIYLGWATSGGHDEITLSTIRAFNYEYFINGNKSRSYQNIWINALKLFLKKHTDINIDLSQIERPRRSEHLPAILSISEVKRLINAYTNIKHKAILLTLYASGLRKSELLYLKLTDIDIDRRVIRIRNSKGAKDRDLPLPDLLHSALAEYLDKYQPTVYLFNGQHRLQYSGSSINKLIKRGLAKTGIKKKITAHSLRHSYATHLVEHQINLRYIQESLGHRSSKTTELYTKLSKEQISRMSSPVDFW